MAFVEPVILRDRGVTMVPLAFEHEDGLKAAAQMVRCGTSA